MKRIVIVGAGSGGVMVANRLRRSLDKDKAEIVVLDKSDQHIYQPGFTMLPFDLCQVEDIVRPVKDLLYDGIEFINKEVTEINPDKNYVVAGGSDKIDYDYLVIATGAQLIMNEPEGVADRWGKNVFTFYTLDSALELKEKLVKKLGNGIDGGKIVVSIAEMPIKCPAAPLKIMFLIEDYVRKLGIRENFEFTITTPLPQIFARQPYAGALYKIFERRNLKAVENYTPATVGDNYIESFDGRKVEFDYLILIPPHKGVDVVENSGLGKPGTGWVDADIHLLMHKKYKNVFAVGDAGDYPTSKTASGARYMAKVMEKNMKRIIEGKEPVAKYDGHIVCPILTRFGRALFAEFDYEKSISPAVESWVNWVLKVHMLIPLYWNMMLKGLM